MKKLYALILTITILGSLPTTNFAQGSPSSTPQSPAVSEAGTLKQETKIVKADQAQIKARVDRERILARLLKEVETGRTVISAAKEREAKLVAEVAAADEAHAKLTEAHAKALIEIGELRAKIFYEEKALKEREQQVQLLREEIKELKGELKAARRRELLNTVKDIVMAAIFILRQ